MTIEDFEKADRILKKVNDIEDKITCIERLEERLSELKSSERGLAKIQIAESWMNTPTCSVDYDRLVSFLDKEISLLQYEKGKLKEKFAKM